MAQILNNNKMNKLTKNKMWYKIEDIAKIATVLTYASILSYVSYNAYIGNLFLHI